MSTRSQLSSSSSRHIGVGGNGSCGNGTTTGMTAGRSELLLGGTSSSSSSSSSGMLVEPCAPPGTNAGNGTTSGNKIECPSSSSSWQGGQGEEQENNEHLIDNSNSSSSSISLARLPMIAISTTDSMLEDDKMHPSYSNTGDLIKNVIARADWKRSSSLILLDSTTTAENSSNSTNNIDNSCFLVPREQYTLDELDNLKDRDFEVRLLMTNHVMLGDKNVLLRSHFSDNHEYSSGSFNFLADFLRASSDTYSYTAAKAALTNLLTIALDADEGDYRTFAVTVASGLSNHGKNTHFVMESYDKYTVAVQERCGVGGRRDDDDDDQLEANRKNFCQLMHIIFSKIPLYKFMVEQDGSNIYRLVHCSSKSTIDDELPMSYAIFSFLLQICLAGYVIAQLIFNIRDGSYTLSPENENLGKIMRNLPLAIFTLMYSILLSIPEVKNVPKGFKVFSGGGLCMLQIMDFIVNAILPILLLVPGFFVILDQEEFVEAVLNAAALLYITGIDDQLPLLLGCNSQSIVKNYLMDKAMEEFDSIKNRRNRGEEETAKGYFGGAKIEGMGVQFCDYYLTNMMEQGSSPADGLIFQPFQIRRGHNSCCGDKIDPSRLVTEECLIRKITWQYDSDDILNKTTHPRISYLKLDLYDSIDPVTIESKRGLNPKEMFHTLHGVFIITTFQMSIDNSITRLRLCGSKDPSDFLKAFTYYPLWNLSKGATSLLDYEARNASVEKLLTTRRRFTRTKSSISRTITSSSTISYQGEEAPYYNRMADHV
jgi:hypothetical protein